MMQLKIRPLAQDSEKNIFPQNKTKMVLNMYQKS